MLPAPLDPGYNGRMEQAEVQCEEQRRRIAAVFHRLVAHYEPRPWKPSGDPVAELVQTILSQNTSDLNSGRAYEELRRTFPTWEDVLAAPTADVAEAIRSRGLAEQKARRIQAVLAEVLSDTDDTEPLAELTTLPLAEAKVRLTTLPGVGPKTAACVLLFACGRPALPVDTHVYRVSRRIGLIDPKISAAAAHDRLERLLEPDEVYPFHVSMIAHGRQICAARRPRCEQCPLTDLCDYYH